MRKIIYNNFLNFTLPLIVVTFFCSYPADSSTSLLVQSSIRYLLNGKMHAEKYQVICTNTKFTSLLSSNCLGSKKCLALNSWNDGLKLDTLYSKYGSPLFKLCQKMGGAPQMVEFEVNKNWHQTNRCLFKDKSFIDLGNLFTGAYHPKKREKIKLKANCKT